MDFRNTTGLPADFGAGSMGAREQMGMVACKIAWRFNSGGPLRLAAPQDQLPVLKEPSELAGVNLLPDLDHRREGVDITLFGQAHAPGGQPVTQLELRVQCGAVDYSVVAIGNRRWERFLLGFRPSEPEPFVTMPITNDRAFGGKAVSQGELLGHAHNPKGRGLCFERGHVSGTEMPNLERPDWRIIEWKDQPQPAVFYAVDGVLFDREGPGSFQALGKAEDPLAFTRHVQEQRAHQTVPGLVCARGKLGRELVLTGFDPAGTLRIPVPPETAVPGRWGPVAHVGVGAQRSRFPLSMVALLVFVPQRALVATYSCAFRYLMRPEERRTAELRWTGAREGSFAEAATAAG